MASRGRIVLAGTLILVAATAAAFPLALFVIWECGGFDSMPLRSGYCRAHPLLSVILLLVAIAGPLYGTVAAATTQRWRPLVVGATLGVISVVGLLLAFLTTWRAL
jgi:hypothetical protein